MKNKHNNSNVELEESFHKFEEKIPLVIMFFSFFWPVDVAGGNGYINDYPTGRIVRDSKLYEIGAGTSEIRKIVIAKALNAEYS